MIVGRGALCVSDVSRATAFYGALGSRPVVQSPGLAVLELRGGTHLVLFEAKDDHPRGPVRSFGLLVGDALTFRAEMARRGVVVGPAWDDGSSRRGFEMTDPDGHVVSVTSAATV